MFSLYAVPFSVNTEPDLISCKGQIHTLCPHGTSDMNLDTVLLGDPAASVEADKLWGSCADQG